MEQQAFWLVSFHDAEANNFVASSQRMGLSFVRVADAFDGVYEKIGALLRTTADPPAHLHVISVLFLSTRYQLRKAVVESMRAHLSDGVQITRRAIESAAFAARINSHPEFAKVWWKAVDGREEYSDFIKKFSGKALFPDGNPVLKELGERYDYASKVFHSSILSMLNRVRMDRQGNELNFYFHAFEVREEDLSEPAGTLLWVLDTHLLILGTFAEAFKPQLKRKHGEVIANLRNLGDMLKAEVEKWHELSPQENSEQ